MDASAEKFFNLIQVDSAGLQGKGVSKEELLKLKQTIRFIRVLMLHATRITMTSRPKLLAARSLLLAGALLEVMFRKLVLLLFPSSSQS